MTQETVDLFMSVRPLKWGGNPKIQRTVPVVEDGSANAEGEGGEGKLTKNQLKKMLKEKQIAEKKAAKAKEKEAADAAKATS